MAHGWPPASTCTASNHTDVTVPDLGTAESTLTITGCVGKASPVSQVLVQIVHSYRGDLVVTWLPRTARCTC
ncbi:hypothetical protein [Dactylosporangium cerinum]